MYIVQNQEGYFLARSGAWVDGREPKQLFTTIHRDEASNELFEANSRDPGLRLDIIDCATDARGLVLIPDDLLPPPLLSNPGHGSDTEHNATEKNTTQPDRESEALAS